MIVRFLQLMYYCFIYYTNIIRKVDIGLSILLYFFILMITSHNKASNFLNDPLAKGSQKLSR